VVGACAGLSILAKVIGVYFLLAACVALLFREQTRIIPGAAGPAEAGGRRSAAIAYRAIIAVGMSAGVAVLAASVFRWHGMAGLLHLVLAIAMLAAVLVRNEVAGPPGSAASRLGEHARLLMPVALGLAVTVGPFLAPYALSGSLGDLARGSLSCPASGWPSRRSRRR
jgi:hypothetical protein